MLMIKKSTYQPSTTVRDRTPKRAAVHKVNSNGGLSAGVVKSVRTEPPEIAWLKKNPNLWPNQNQLPPNFNLVTRQ